MQGRQIGGSCGNEKPGRRVVWGADRCPKTVFFFIFFFIFEGAGGALVALFTPVSKPGCDGSG